MVFSFFSFRFKHFPIEWAWIARNVVYCPGLSSFKALLAYQLFLKDLASSLSDTHLFLNKIKPSRFSFYNSLKLTISKGLIKSSLELGDWKEENSLVSPKAVKKNTGLYFEGFRIDQTFSKPGLPTLINYNDQSQLWSMVRDTPVEKLFLN